MADPIEDIIGDYRAFAAQQRDRLATRGIDITPYGLSHLAYRVPEWDQYVHVRGLIERHAVANRENVWNGRPISLIVPAEPLEVLDGKVVPLIELIPPVHQRVYKMGLEHLGVVVGDTFDAFVEAHKPVLTGQQFQGPNSTPDPVYILFEDFTHVKFYRLSLRASVELDAGPFDDGFHHVDDWVPQRLVEWRNDGETRLVTLFAIGALAVGMSSTASAITWGRPDVNNEYPNVASFRGIVDATNTARISCSGSLLYRDAEKVVILTAAHCTDSWTEAIAAGTIDSVGVSFDQNNQVNGSTTDGTFYVRGGVPISLPGEGRSVRDLRLRARRVLRRR